MPRVQDMIAGTPGLWLAYWGDEAKKHDMFDVLSLAGFVRTGTLTYEHHGSPIYAYRYDRPEAFGVPVGVFGDIALRRATWPQPVAAGDDLHVLLWWSAETPPPVDYTVSVFLLDATGKLRAQHDGYPAAGTRPTSSWSAGELVFDAHAVTLPGDLPPGTYTVGVKLYTWWDGAILPTAAGEEFATLGTLTVR